MKRFLPKDPLEWACVILAITLITLLGWWMYVLGVISALLVAVAIFGISYNSDKLRKEWNNNPPR